MNDTNPTKNGLDRYFKWVGKYKIIIQMTAFKILLYRIKDDIIHFVKKNCYWSMEIIFIYEDWLSEKCLNKVKCLMILYFINNLS